MNFCTLFDSKYIDRALVMYDSLSAVCSDLALYVIAFDKACFDVLSELALPGVTAVSYEDFEDDTLRRAKENRSRREFLWTCSGYSIRYLMKRFSLPDLTYIDSDLYFYDPPERALGKFLDGDHDVAIIPHGYSDHPENDYNSRMYGRYCVEFNTFKNTPNGMKILDWWIDKCLEACPENAVNGLFGDQKYLDDLQTLFEGVYVYEDFGLGIAPWNVDDYVAAGDLIENRHTHESGRLIFYHFHSLDVFPDGGSNIRVFIRPGRHDRKLVESLYRPYISRLLEKRRYLSERFGLGSDEEETVKILHEGELKMFLTCEPNIVFLVRKIWRYLFNKKKDYIFIGKDGQ